MAMVHCPRSIFLRKTPSPFLCAQRQNYYFLIELGGRRFHSLIRMVKGFSPLAGLFIEPTFLSSLTSSCGPEKYPTVLPLSISKEMNPSKDQLDYSSSRFPDSRFQCRADEKLESKSPTLLERIQGLDRSTELAHHYTPFLLFNNFSSKLVHDQGDDSKQILSYVVVGHAQNSFIHSKLIYCKNDCGDHIFSMDKIMDKTGKLKEVLRLKSDIKFEKQRTTTYLGNNYCENKRHFERRTKELECVTDHLLSTGVISHKHSDVYPVTAFMDSTLKNNANCGSSKNSAVLALINRSTAPFLGIDSVGVHLHCYVTQQQDPSITQDNNCHRKPKIKGLWLARRAPTKSHHPNCWDPTVAGGQPAKLSLLHNIIKEAYEEAGVPSEWINNSNSTPGINFSDYSHDPLKITTANSDGSCMKRSLYYSFDLEVPSDWTPTPVDGEVSEFKLYSMNELEREVLFGDAVRPAMRAVLLDFMMRHGVLTSVNDKSDLEDLKNAMRRNRLVLW